MPPREDGAPKSFTWITGDPRSKQNITQIRRHAGQNSGVKAENSARARSSSSPKPGGHRSSVKAFRAVQPSSKTDETTDKSFNTYGDAGNPLHVNYPSGAAENAAVPSPASTNEPVNVYQPFYPVPSILREASSSSEEAPPTRKVAIWDLVNHSAEEEERHRLELMASTPGQDTDDGRHDYFGNHIDHAELKQALSEVRAHSPRNARKESPAPATIALQANISKRRRPDAQAGSSNASWRIGMAPSAVMTLSKEDSQIEQILIQTSTFYTSKFESSWFRQVHESRCSLDTGSVENFSGSITTAAGLLAIGRIDSASSILSRVLPTLSDLLILQPPKLYYVLAELSLDASSNELGRLRSQVKRFAAAASLTILGASHPITMLLQLTLTNADQRLRLRELIQRKIHELHEQLFSATSNETTGHYWYLARVLAQLGRLDEAARILTQIIPIWENTHGINSLLPVTGLLELTKVHLALKNTSKGTESFVSDALRRTLAIEKAAEHQPSSQLAELVHSRMGCLRTLGRLHVMRGNVETAMMQYTAAVGVGVAELGAAVPAVQLAVADLDTVTRMAVHPDDAEGPQDDADRATLPPTVRLGPDIRETARLNLMALNNPGGQQRA
ncbi:uncharacterized protein Z520_08885 [Fonsecaea multimorphosa CBS 102226]|uniref:Uncharacterized protein n=1 Tax=Fonsecaea multimorphosa CBS 102226 TaxID=1442371 RepID=A0A0D2KFB1_9EURO|nr:uncharacterized protein Z520_08885 [Fonsecaea multimorphosa CBS 102226]KIX95368.1 hypothetical protein Z520_08885 [Fonsecaea multimorphosa CBS 102226]OAL21036.1 hypothetical protein AYO22_08320 [Fonsecaea multimorphosa]